MLLGFYFIVLIGFIFGSVKMVNHFATPSNKIFFSGLFWILSIFFVYLIYNSVNGPIKFEKEKKERLQIAVNKLQDIRKAQLAYKAIKGRYAANFQEIEELIENERFAIIQRKDTSVIDVAKNSAYRLTVGSDGTGGYFKDIVLMDTIGFVSIKDSLFKNSDRYKRLKEVKIGSITARVDMKSAIIEKGDLKIPVFEAIIKKKDVLRGLDPDMILKEEKIIGVDEINGATINLGSLIDINTNGNWPKSYGSNE